MKSRIPIKATKREERLSWIYGLVCNALWALLILASIHLVVYYFYFIFARGYFDKESMNMGVYIIIEAFMFLFIHKNKVREIFKVKK